MPPIAEIAEHRRHVRFVPKTDIRSVWTRHVLVLASAADTINQRGLLPLHEPKGLLQEAQDFFRYVGYRTFKLCPMAQIPLGK
jgi:hypothetical protein